MFYFNIKKTAKPITREARVARLPSLGAPLHVSLENRAHNTEADIFSGRYYYILHIKHKTVSVSHPAAWVTLDRT